MGKDMSKVYQVVIYRQINDEEKLRQYAELARPAVLAAGGKFLARGEPYDTRENGQVTRTVVVEWPSREAAEYGYECDAYQAALAVLGDGADREFRFLDGVE
jgi:uncharacterized protein (DUF1330 family)